MADYQLPAPVREITNSEKFSKYFQQAMSDLQDQTARLQSLSAVGGERADAVSHCQAGIARLSDAVRDAASIIPAYDQRSYGQALKTLTTKLEEARSSFAPRPKFSFKSAGLSSLGLQKNASAISIGDAAELASQKRRLVPGHSSGVSTESSMATTPAKLRSPAPERGEDENLPTDRAETLPQQSTAIKIDDLENVHFVLPPSDGYATSSGTVSNLRRCVVNLSSPTSSGHPLAGLTLKNITNSLIICGHVSGAAHLTNVKSSTIVVASRQFRMHESHDCDVYLSTTSRPIIEDCSAVRFAPLPEVLRTESVAGAGDQWMEVDDFKWLKSEPSPNWSVSDVAHRVLETDWRDIVSGGTEVDAGEILRAVDVK
ncbi:hypothetical protein LTR08_002508 [Meristemomyces frigidus]|nr:hypothetical protein LTR08_002508 [Meristemomyces frigidus]